MIQKKFARKELCGNVKTKQKVQHQYSSRVPIAKVKNGMKKKVGVMNSEIQCE